MEFGEELRKIAWIVAIMQGYPYSTDATNQEMSQEISGHIR